MRSLACLLIVLGGCGSPDCKTAVEKAFTATHAPDMKFAPKVIAMCEKDGWSGEVRTCLANVKSDADAETCLAKVDSLNSEVRRDRLEVEEARKRAVEAQEAAAKAAKAAKIATDNATAAQRETDDLAGKLAAAVDAVANAKTAADRQQAQLELEVLRLKKKDLELRLAEMKMQAARAERTKGVQISKQCLDNPLAAGCN